MPEDTKRKIDRLTDYYCRLASRHGTRKTIRFLVSAITHHRQKPPCACTIEAGLTEMPPDDPRHAKAPGSLPGPIALETRPL